MFHTPITTLELQRIPISRGPLVELLETELGHPITHEYRHYLAGQPIGCGETLELFRGDRWIPGQYEWTGNPADSPTFEHSIGVIELTGLHLLRWPQTCQSRLAVQ
jgi:hypothetical protein